MQSLAEGYSHDHSVESHHRERIKKYIAAHINNPDLDVQSIAEAVGLSRRYVHKLFSNEPQHLMQWVLIQRLEHCRCELNFDHEHLRTIGEIALAWGFHDQSHFSKAFRKHFGFTPSEVHGQDPAPINKTQYHPGIYRDWS